jgi:methylated-DNA-protein-cysteine methyltransferase related protein
MSYISDGLPAVGLTASSGSGVARQRTWLGARGSGVQIPPPRPNHVSSKTDRADPRAERILARVRAIPVGFVRTYGDIDPKAPRMVGHILATTRERLPWHRIVRADGSLARGSRQRRLLIKEGIPMRGDRVDLRIARLPSSF